ncbi:hypothetical protein CYMTET_52912, partial [Cymbomonas tetramitiformis]
PASREEFAAACEQAQQLLPDTRGSSITFPQFACKGTDTWEPLKNLPGLEDGIKEFEQKLESEKAEHAREVAEGKEKKRKERSRDVEGDEETEFETPPKNLRSPFGSTSRHKEILTAAMKNRSADKESDYSCPNNSDEDETPNPVEDVCQDYYNMASDGSLFAGKETACSGAAYLDKNEEATYLSVEIYMRRIA